MLTPALRILPASQLSFWNEEKHIPGNFVLYGGTALALRLGHRQSLDFDFFSSAPIELEHLSATIPFVKEAEVLQSGPNTLTLRIDRACADGRLAETHDGGRRPPLQEEITVVSAQTTLRFVLG